MTTYKFKTNINCGGCKSSVQPYLDELEGIDSWQVDTNDSDKVLTVNTDHVSQEAIIQKVEEAGFKAESCKPGIFDKLFR